MSSADEESTQVFIQRQLLVQLQANLHRISFPSSALEWHFLWVDYFVFFSESTCLEPFLCSFEPCRKDENWVGLWAFCSYLLSLKLPALNSWSFQEELMNVLEVPSSSYLLIQSHHSSLLWLIWVALIDKANHHMLSWHCQNLCSSMHTLAPCFPWDH